MAVSLLVLAGHLGEGLDFLPCSPAKLCLPSGQYNPIHPHPTVILPVSPACYFWWGSPYTSSPVLWRGSVWGPQGGCHHRGGKQCLLSPLLKTYCSGNLLSIFVSFCLHLWFKYEKLHYDAIHYLSLINFIVFHLDIYLLLMHGL